MRVLIGGGGGGGLTLAHDVPKAGIDVQVSKQQLASYPFIQFGTGHAYPIPCVFKLQINAESRYEILNSDSDNGLVNPVPTICRDSEGSLKLVAATLRHLPAFKFFESLQNRHPDPAFISTFAFEVVTHTIAHDGFFDVAHNDTWISNTSSASLYLTVFEFQQSWEVSNLVRDASGGDNVIVGPGSCEELSIEMTVPSDSTKMGQAIDIIKVFVTSRATHFPGAILPKLGEGFLRDDGFRDFEYLLKCIDGFTSMRSGSENGWMTQNFSIRTHAKCKNSS